MLGGSGVAVLERKDRGNAVIYFFAGPHRNGSHFQFYVAQEALSQIGHPYRILDPVPFHKHNLAASKRVLDAAAQENGVFLAKGHWYHKKELELLQSYKNLRVMVIWRNVVGAMMSSFRYYYAKSGRKEPRFEDFYWKDKGRWMLIEQHRHRRAYRNYDAFQSSYEGLIKDFAAEAARLLNELGIDGQTDLGDLEMAVSKPQLREKFGDRDAVFFGRSASSAGARTRPTAACLSDFRKVAAMSDRRLAAESLIEAARLAPRYLGPYGFRTGCRRLAERRISFRR